MCVEVQVVTHAMGVSDISDRSLREGSQHFVINLIDATCDTLGTKLATITAYHLQTIGQTKRYNKTDLRIICKHIIERCIKAFMTHFSHR